MKKISFVSRSLNRAGRKSRTTLSITLTLIIVLATAAVATFNSWGVATGQSEIQEVDGSKRRVSRDLPGDKGAADKGAADDLPDVGDLRPAIGKPEPETLAKELGRLLAPAAVSYVDALGICGGNSPCFTTIQAAINAASAGDTINVYAGTYAEQINIDKALTLLGPNANINPNTGSRVAEAIIIPTASDPINPGFAGPIVVTLR